MLLHLFYITRMDYFHEHSSFAIEPSNFLEQENHNYSVARDSFLAHLGATLSGSMRHIMAPSIADRAYHYYQKISFQLYFISQEVVD